MRGICLLQAEHYGQQRRPKIRPSWLLCFVVALAFCLCGQTWVWAQEFSLAARQLATHKFIASRQISRVPRGQRAASFEQALQVLAKATRNDIPGQVGTVPSYDWQPLGPAQVKTTRYGLVTGQITSIATDPSDSTGNTVFVGTAGGGVWYSKNAAGPASQVSFTPLTDSISDFAPPKVGSLSIGAVSVQPGGTGVVLAGTGNPNSGTGSYFGVGILRSGDGGKSWSLIPTAGDVIAGSVESFSGSAFAGFAWSTKNTNLVVAAVTDAASIAHQGSPADASDSILGLYYSTNAGVTWTLASIFDGTTEIEGPDLEETTDGNAVTSVVWNPVRKMFYAAIRYHGYYESSDGQNWTRLTAQPGSGLNSAALCPSNVGASGAKDCPIQRGALAVQPETGDTFALTVDRKGYDQGLWVDTCGASAGSCTSSSDGFSEQIADVPIESFEGSLSSDKPTIPSAGYSLSLAAVPYSSSAGNTALLVGTQDLYSCLLTNSSGSASCQWSNLTNTNGCAAAMVAPYQHAIAAAAGSSGLIYLGNDGGLWSTTLASAQAQSVCSSGEAASFQNLNSGLGSLADVSNFAVNPKDSQVFMAALGELGSAGTANGGQNWSQVLDGQSNQVLIDPSSPSNWFATADSGAAIAECTQGTSCTASDFTPVIDSDQLGEDALTLGSSVWMFDPLDPSSFLIGTCRVWRGPISGQGWNTNSQLSTMLDGNQLSYCNGNQQIASLTAVPVLDASGNNPNGTEQIYAGMNDSYEPGALQPGQIFTQTVSQSPAGPVTWSNITAISGDEHQVVNTPGVTQFNPGGYSIAGLYADPLDSSGQTIYAAVQGFSTGESTKNLLYMSTDGGDTWYNISSNLPDAPANSVVVDPNNANVVYVATDAGVWETGYVSNCKLAPNSCWTLMGSGLPQAPVEKLGIFNWGAQTLLLAGTYGRGTWEIPLLSTSYAQTNASLSPSPTVDFGNQQVETISAPKTITLTNNGPLDLNLTSAITVTGEFNIVSNNCGTELAPLANCAIEVDFAPTSVGPQNGVLTVPGNTVGGKLSVALTGYGLSGASVVLNPSSLNFGNVIVGQTSTPAQSATISNVGGESLSVSQVSVTGDFTLTANTCVGQIAPQSGCTVSLVFTPTAAGLRSGELIVNDGEGTQQIQLSGTGLLPGMIQVSPQTLNFGTQPIGTLSTARAVTLSNSGDATAQDISVQVSGSFQAVNNCGASLPGSTSCSIAVSYLPTVIGTQTGTLTVTDSVSPPQTETHTVALTGIGVAGPGLNVSPDPVNFGGYLVGATSPVQTVTLINNGNSSFSNIGASTSANFSIADNNCTGTLAVGGSCTLGLTFTPPAAGPFSGALTLSLGNTGQTQSVPLEGAGDDFTLAVNGSSSFTITGGVSVVYNFTATPLGGTTGPVAFTCSGAPAGSTCTVNPATGNFNGQAPIAIQLTVNTGTASARLLAPQRPSSLKGWAGVALCMTPLGLLGIWKRRRRLPLLLVICMVGLSALAGGVLLSGCGVKAGAGVKIGGNGGGGGGGGTVGGVAPGAYTITLSASMPSATQPVLTKTAQVQLTVE